MDRFFIFLVTAAHVLVFCVVFNIIPRIEEKDYKKIGKYQKVSLIYFPELFFVTWAINELITKSNGFGFISFYWILLIFIQSFVFIIPTRTVFLRVKNGNFEFVENPRKTRRMMILLFLLLLLIVVPLATVSYLNKTKVYRQIEEIEMQGIRVYHEAYYFSGKTTPTKLDSYTEVLELAKANDLTLYVSNGSPDYHFLTVSGLIQIWFYPPEGRVSMIQID